MNILFVCTGNTCRSPMAEELLRCMAKELQIDDLEVSSAGTDHDIEDPFGGDSDVYLKTLDQIELALVVLLIKLYPQHAEEIRRVYEPKG